MDALGFSQLISRADHDGLLELWRSIDRQYYRFRAKIPHKFMIVGSNSVWGSREFETIRLNDMFVLFSRQFAEDLALRYLISACLLYQTMLLEGFVPRGGLGFGLIVRGNGLLIGNGFIDAYQCAEKRPESTRHVCAVEISRAFLQLIVRSQKAMRLLCFYPDAFFVHPFALFDPDLGKFDGARVLGCLSSANANNAKI